MTSFATRMLATPAAAIAAASQMVATVTPIAPAVHLQQRDVRALLHLRVRPQPRRPAPSSAAIIAAMFARSSVRSTISAGVCSESTGTPLCWPYISCTRSRA